MSNRLEVDQAKANRALTAASIPEYRAADRARREQPQRAASAARRPRSARRRRSATRSPPAIPAGLPASLLERRPDVLAAEQLLVAANANVGAAKALFYPTITLTGSAGAISGSFSNFLTPESMIWSLGAGLFQPLFNGGRMKQNYEANKARFDQAIAQYQRTALNGYREVADALVEHREVRRAAVGARGRRRGAPRRGRSSPGRGTTRGCPATSKSWSPTSSCSSWSSSWRRRAASSGGRIALLYRALGGGWQPRADAPAPPATTPPLPPPPIKK